MTPPSPCMGSIRMPAVSGPIACSTAARSANGTWSKPSTGGTEAFQILGVAGGRDGRQRAAVEGAFEGDDAPALRLAAHIVIAPGRLDRGLAGFRARIAEEDAVGERRRDEPLRQPLLVGDAIEVGGVPELLRLLGQGRDEPGVRMTQNVDRDARGEVEIALARFASPAKRLRPARRRDPGGYRSPSRRVTGPVVWAAAWVLESEAAKDADIGARPSAAFIGSKIKKAAFRGGPGTLLIRARPRAVNAS